jgi:hypothetical protein
MGDETAMSVRLQPWWNSIYWWKNGRPEPLAEQLRGGAAIPEDVREFLAGVVEGSIAKKRGRHHEFPIENSFELTWRLVEEVRGRQAEHKRLRRVERARTGKTAEGTPAEMALIDAAKKFKMKPGTVKKMVRSKLGKIVGRLLSPEIEP